MADPNARPTGGVCFACGEALGPVSAAGRDVICPNCGNIQGIPTWPASPDRPSGPGDSPWITGAAGPGEWSGLAAESGPAPVQPPTVASTPGSPWRAGRASVETGSASRAARPAPLAWPGKVEAPPRATRADVGRGKSLPGRLGRDLAMLLLGLAVGSLLTWVQLGSRQRPEDHPAVAEAREEDSDAPAANLVEARRDARPGSPSGEDARGARRTASPSRPTEPAAAETGPVADGPDPDGPVIVPARAAPQEVASLSRPPVAAPARQPSTPPPRGSLITEFHYPRSIGEIRSRVREILEEPGEPGQPDEAEAALRRLRAYRYLAGLPYQTIRLDRRLNTLALKAARICEQLGYLTHTPRNPGLPEYEYLDARLAAGKSNLSYRSPPESLAGAVDAWMSDSDDANIGRLGHRRWCLSPGMGRTGFARSGEYAAMWAHDTSDRPFEDYTMIAHPAPGYMPSDFFGARDAWSVTLNPRLFRGPRREKTRVRIYRVEQRDIRRDEPLRLDYFQIETSNFAVQNCIIFRPRSLDTSDGCCYWVEIRGLERAEGVPYELGYLVEFVR